MSLESIDMLFCPQMAQQTLDPVTQAEDVKTEILETVV
jgi:hypothetical protein